MLASVLRGWLPATTSAVIVARPLDSARDDGGQGQVVPPRCLRTYCEVGPGYSHRRSLWRALEAARDDEERDVSTFPMFTSVLRDRLPLAGLLSVSRETLRGRAAFQPDFPACVIPSGVEGRATLRLFAVE
jgi:hypothetical protein